MSSVKKIYIAYDNNFPNYLVGEVAKISILADLLDGNTINITNDIKCSISSLDDNNIFIDPTTLTATTVDAVFKTEGSGIIKAAYTTPDGRRLFSSKQFICYTDFFKTNYLSYFFTSSDKDKIENNEYVKVMFDTLMEMMDILYAYNEDLKIISNFSTGKSKFLSLAGQSIGFERLDFTSLNTPLEANSNEIFKELLASMLDLLSIRGTKLAYELFFGALGYNITIQEFWYDDEGNLIDINSDDEEASTFYAYRTDGTNIDDPPVERKDPRSGVRSTDSVFRNSKSNFIRVSIDSSKNTEIAESPASFSQEKRLIIRRYLDFLRPSHIQYITEAFGGAVNQDTLDKLEEAFALGRLANYPEDFGFITNPLSEEIFNKIFGTISAEYEQFIIGIIKGITTEVSSKTRWDSGVRFDRADRWDSRRFLDEAFTVARI